MIFHLPSFLLGYVSGVATVVFARQLKPIAVELGRVATHLTDDVLARVAMLREDAEDAIAEGRARARAPRPVTRRRTARA